MIAKLLNGNIVRDDSDSDVGNGDVTKQSDEPKIETLLRKGPAFHDILCVGNASLIIKSMDITCDYLAWGAFKESGVHSLYTTRQQTRHRNKEFISSIH